MTGHRPWRLVARKQVPPSYHDLYVTTATIARARVFDLPYGLEVTCTRVTGWRLYRHRESGQPELLAGEYDNDWLVLDVAGHVIVDSRRIGNGAGDGDSGGSDSGEPAGLRGDDLT